MTQRIAPNNQLPEECIIEVWKPSTLLESKYFKYHTENFKFPPSSQTLAVFKVRQNKLPTKHKF